MCDTHTHTHTHTKDSHPANYVSRNTWVGGGKNGRARPELCALTELRVGVLRTAHD